MERVYPFGKFTGHLVGYLGGINEKNLCKLNAVKSESFACLSAIKKKPAKIINRLF